MEVTAHQALQGETTMWTPELPFDPLRPAGHAPRRTRSALAASLRAAGRLLDGMALRLSWTQPPAPVSEPLLEFHSEAGAPEGALYVNGQLVGHVLGVKRL
jgi:hypothetical protein